MVSFRMHGARSRTLCLCGLVVYKLSKALEYAVKKIEVYLLKDAMYHKVQATRTVKYPIAQAVICNTVAPKRAASLLLMLPWLSVCVVSIVLLC
jgi:hypothetical protein